MRMDNLPVDFDTQAIVIGGGPSGAWAAEHLARRGIRTVLLEAGGQDTQKLCSGLLNTEGQRALGCKLPQHLRRLPFEPQLEFHDLDNRLRLRYAPRYWNMDRPSFDAWLRERAAEAGADLQYRRRVGRVELSNDGVTVLTSAGSLKAKIAIDATGWKALGRRLTAGAGIRSVAGGTPTPAKVPHIHAFQGVVESNLPEASMWAVFVSGITPYYGWLVPKGGGQFLLGAGFPQGAGSTRRSGEAAEQTDSNPWGKLDYIFERIDQLGYKAVPLDEKPEGTPITTITSTSQLWWGSGRLFTVGESSAMVSPSSGDGIHFGLEHAHALADELIGCSAFNGNTPSELHQAVASKVERRLRSSIGELRFNCLKSRVAAKTFTRGIAARLLPLYLRRPVERIAM
jgi:geranylgeranyl reductase